MADEYEFYENPDFDFDDLPSYEDLLADVSFDKMKEFFLERIISQDKSVEDALINIYSYFMAMSKGQPNNYNFFLCGPSGCGKTEFTRVLTEYCRNRLPFVSVTTKDISTITTEGFKGADKDFLVADIDKPYAIVFLDEIDKLLVPKFTSRGEQVSVDIQAGVLQIIEGNQVTLSSKGAHGQYKTIDTTKILFIGCGAFEGIEDYQKAVVQKTEDVDFGYRNAQKVKVRQPLTHEDIVRWGGLPQFVGRFCEVINFNAVNADSIRPLVELRLNDFRPMFDFDISVTDRYVAHIADCIDTKFGVRILKAELWKHLKHYTLHNDGGLLKHLTLDWKDGQFEGIASMKMERGD